MKRIISLIALVMFSSSLEAQDARSRIDPQKREELRLRVQEIRQRVEALRMELRELRGERAEPTERDGRRQQRRSRSVDPQRAKDLRQRFREAGPIERRMLLRGVRAWRMLRGQQRTPGLRRR